ncbi:RNA 2',3'-cyclic phosphodiesterase [Lentibacillus halophilus]|uniref:RNA 2',3'-cyclic phosphodiesterase n=1 Tax=Lentibacillus halophilus TaxID=295065 RepID=A0ABN0Z2G8_9BACI
MNLSHYFIAIPLSEQWKQWLAVRQSEIKRQLPYKQWTHRDDLHVTMKFLGPVADSDLDMLLEQLHGLETIFAFHVHAGELGTFGNPSAPRVLWTGVEKTPDLINLHQCVEAAAADAGFQPEKRPFKPHITLAKKWNGSKMDMKPWQERYSTQHVFTVDQVTVYRIFPAQLPKYQSIRTFDLLKGNH